MSPIRPAIAALPAMVLLAGVGWFVGDHWLNQIADTLERVSVQLVATDPSARSSQCLGVAAAMGAAPLLALLVRAGISRVSRAPATLGQWAVSMGFVLLGSQAGIGGALFNTARVSVPSALDASAQLGVIQLNLSELALGGWALAGAGGAAILVLAVGITTAGLEQSEPSGPPPAPLC